MSSLFRQLAVFDPVHSWKHLIEAEKWEHLAEAEITSHFKECNTAGFATALALSPARRSRHAGRREEQKTFRICKSLSEIYDDCSFSSDVFGYIDGAITLAHPDDCFWVLKDESIQHNKRPHFSFSRVLRAECYLV